MSESLEDRIRRVAAENYDTGKADAYAASDIVEILDAKDAEIRRLRGRMRIIAEARYGICSIAVAGHDRVNVVAVEDIQRICRIARDTLDGV